MEASGTDMMIIGPKKKSPDYIVEEPYNIELPLILINELCAK